MQMVISLVWEAKHLYQWGDFYQNIPKRDKTMVPCKQKRECQGHVDFRT